MRPPNRADGKLRDEVSTKNQPAFAIGDARIKNPISDAVSEGEESKHANDEDQSD